ERCKYNPLFLPKSLEEATSVAYDWVEEPSGERRPLKAQEKRNINVLTKKHRICMLGGLTSHSGGPSTQFPYTFRGRVFRPSVGGWKTNLAGMQNLEAANRLEIKGNTLRYVRYFDDFPATALSDIWLDT